MNRVEHVERVEDSEKGLSHKVHKEHKDGFGKWGFTPYPECELITGYVLVDGQCIIDFRRDDMVEYQRCQ